MSIDRAEFDQLVASYSSPSRSIPEGDRKQLYAMGKAFESVTNSQIANLIRLAVRNSQPLMRSYQSDCCSTTLPTTNCISFCGSHHRRAGFIRQEHLLACCIFKRIDEDRSIHMAISLPECLQLFQKRDGLYTKQHVITCQFITTSTLVLR